MSSEPQEQAPEVTTPVEEQSSPISGLETTGALETSGGEEAGQEEKVGDQQEVAEVTEKLAEIDLETEGEQKEVKAQQEAEDEQSQEQEEFYTRDLVEVTRSSINFNKTSLFPGSIDQIELSINLKEEYFADLDPASSYRLKVVALCSEAKFNDLDQYVFSVRRSERFEYFEEVHFNIRKDEKAQVRVAVKVPAVKETQMIEGTLSIQLADTFPVYLPITAKCEIPQIVCLKELYDEKEGVTLIKIPGKKGNMRMPPIPFKNTSPYNFLLQVETVSFHDMSERLYDVVNANSTINCSANSPFFVTLQLKPNLSHRGAVPKTQTIRKVIILKVKNGSMCFSYPIEVYLYESAGGSNVS